MPGPVSHGPWNSFPREAFPYNGFKHIAYRSSDGMIVAGGCTAAGKGSLVWPCDEFLYVLQGSIKCEVVGGENFTCVKGDVMYIPRGTEINFEMTPDYENLTIYISTDGQKVTLA